MSGTSWDFLYFIFRAFKFGNSPFGIEKFIPISLTRLDFREVRCFSALWFLYFIHYNKTNSISLSAFPTENSFEVNPWSKTVPCLTCTHFWYTSIAQSIFTGWFPLLNMHYYCWMRQFHKSSPAPQSFSWAWGSTRKDEKVLEDQSNHL